MNASRSLSLLILPAALLIIGGGIYVTQSKWEPTQPDRHWHELSEKIKTRVKRYPRAAGIIVKDLKRGWTISHNPGRLFPSASLVKIPVMAALYQAEVKGHISLDDSFPILRRLKAKGSGNLRYNKPGTRFTVRELIYRMITESDNTATNVLANMFGLEYYNAQFLNLGLRHTNFSRMIMDLRKRNRGIDNYTTAEDMARLLELIYKSELEGSEEMLEILKDQKINDRLAAGIPAGWQIGHKTGLLRNTCHDVGIIYSPTNDYLICALTNYRRDPKWAKLFITDISKLAAAYYSDPSLQPEKKPFWYRILSRDREGQG